MHAMCSKARHIENPTLGNPGQIVLLLFSGRFPDMNIDKAAGITNDPGNRWLFGDKIWNMK